MSICKTKMNYEQCLKITKELHNYFKGKDNLATIIYPKNVKFKTDEYYYYIFYSCLLDYGMRSLIYHKNLLATYNKYPEIFNPKLVLEMDIEKLKDILVNNVHPRYPNIAIKKWLELSMQLAKYKSISILLANIKSFEELHQFIKNIKGYGQKTGGLLIREICESKICDFKSDVKVIPIDRHDIEISYLTGIIDTQRINENEIKELSNLYVKVAEDLNINPSSVDKYLWVLGANICSKKKCSECPLNNYCKKNKNDLK